MLAALAVWAATGDAAGISMLVLLSAVTLWSLRRPRLKMTESAIIVANLVTTRRIKWGDIAGFAYGEYRRSWCVEVDLVDGSKVPVRVLSDNLDTGGNPSERVSAAVADLRFKLEAHTGIRARPSKTVALGDGSTFDLESIAGSDVGVRRAKRRLRWLNVCMVALGLFFIGLGVGAVVDAAKRPHTYATLRDRGVLLSARFEGCGHVDRFDKNGKDDVCRLTVTYQGRTRKWVYRDDYPQFNQLGVGASIPVLLDPSHPTTVYTVHDVDTHDNAGVFSAYGLFGFGSVCAGIGLIAWLARNEFRTRRELRQIEELADIHAT